jgi:hypothetical protein
MSPFDGFEPDGMCDGDGCCEHGSVQADGSGGLAGAGRYDPVDESDMGAMPVDGPGPEGIAGTDGGAAPATHNLQTAPSDQDVAQARQALVGDGSSLASTPAAGDPALGGDMQVAAQPATPEPQPAAGSGTPGQPAEAAQGPTKAELEAELQRANENAETTALLSNIAKVRHDTAMSVINNIR